MAAQYLFENVETGVRHVMYSVDGDVFLKRTQEEAVAEGKRNPWRLLSRDAGRAGRAPGGPRVPEAPAAEVVAPGMARGGAGAGGDAPPVPTTAGDPTSGQPVAVSRGGDGAGGDVSDLE